MFTKVSICIMMLRITTNKTYIKALQALIAALILSNIILSILWIVQCTPDPEKAWDYKSRGSSCFSRTKLERIIISQARKFDPSNHVFSLQKAMLTVNQSYLVFPTSYFLLPPILSYETFRSEVSTKSACVS